MATKHSHSHLGREHSDHDHGDGARSSHQALVWALVVTGGMALVEGIGAFWSGSLALLSDAGHMATDAAALGLALFASRIARRPPTRRASYGYVRAEGAAAILLMPLRTAHALKVQVRALLIGTASNQDGHSSSLTVPS